MADGSGRTAIWVAVIGLVGVLGAALIANRSSLFPPHDSSPSTDSPPPIQGHTPDLNEGVFIDDSSSRVQYNEGGGWRNNPDYNNLENTQHYTYNPGSTAGLQFKGNWIELLYYRAPGGALMRVAVDDQNLEEIDTGTDDSKTSYGQSKRYDSLGTGEHRIVVTHSGHHTEGRQQSAAAGPSEPNGYYINIDGFRVSKAEN